MENLTTTQKIFFAVLGIIVVIILVVYVFTRDNSTVYFEDEFINSSEKVNGVSGINTTEMTQKKIIVHIAGQVVNEGIVELLENARVYDAIEAAGGMTAEADLSKVNLATIIKDGQKIYIPSKYENEENENLVNINADIFNIEDTNNIEINSSYSEKIDINIATQSELETIPGIGTSTALKIINYRKENGKFKDIEDIKNVSGIGDAKFESIKNYIVVN